MKQNKRKQKTFGTVLTQKFLWTTKNHERNKEQREGEQEKKRNRMQK